MLWNQRIVIARGKIIGNWPAAVSFIPEFISDGSYSIDQLFNCDEMGLYYQLLPQKALAGHLKSADGCKTQRACVTIDAFSNGTGSTINAFSNGTGNIKLPLLFIEKAKNPQCFSQENLPVMYHSQANAWANGPLFKD